MDTTPFYRLELAYAEQWWDEVFLLLPFFLFTGPNGLVKLCLSASELESWGFVSFLPLFSLLYVWCCNIVVHVQPLGSAPPR